MSIKFVDLFDTVVIDNKSYTDIFTKNYSIESMFNTDASIYRKLIITPGSRLDEIANSLYGDANLWWIVAMYAEMLDPIEAEYMSQEEILATADRVKVEIETRYPEIGNTEVTAIYDDVINTLTAHVEDNNASIPAISPSYLSDMLITIKRTLSD